MGIPDSVKFQQTLVDSSSENENMDDASTPFPDVSVNIYPERWFRKCMELEPNFWRMKC